MAVFLPGLGFLSATPVKLAAGILLALAAYGGEAKLLRLTLLLFAGLYFLVYTLTARTYFRLVQ